MKKFIILMVMLCIASQAFGAWAINNKNVSNPLLLRKLLTDRIGTLDSKVTVLQNSSPGINSVGTGDIFYVDSSASNGAATTWATAKTTLDAAIGLCADDNGDIIYVAQGHAETLLADITADINGLTIYMLGEGDNAPAFTYDTTTDEFIIDASAVTIYGGRYIAGIAEVAAAFTLADDSDYFTIINAEFPEPGTATFEFDKVFQLVTGADNGTIAYCTVINQAGTPGMTSVIDGAAAAIDSLTVIGNHFNVDADVAIIFSDQADTNLIIANNTFIQENTAQFCIEFTSTATGIISDNFYGNLGGIAYLIDPGSCFQVDNVAVMAIDSAGMDWPTRAGQMYASVMTATSQTDDLFDVDGGAIEILSFAGVVTTQIGAVGNTIAIDFDADSGWIDSDFSTAVETNADVVGTRYTFSNDPESVLVPVSNTAGNTNLMESWFCGEGMIEQTASGSTTGVIKWYMTWTPYEDGTTVTAQ